MPNDIRRPMTRHPALATVATLVLAAAPLVNISGLSGAPEQTAPQIVKITGGQHKLLLRSDGTVAGWGQCREGQLGPLGGITRESSDRRPRW
jgi:hypothetical protein